MRHLRISTLFAFSAVLLLAALLPACGKKTVRSEQIEPTPVLTDTPTVLPTESPTSTADNSLSLIPESAPTAVPTATPTATVAAYSYVPETVTMEQDADSVEAKPTPKPRPIKTVRTAAKISVAPTATPTTVATAIPTPEPTSAVLGSMKNEPMTPETVPTSKSSSKIWTWLLLLLVVAGALLYYWRRNQDEDPTPGKPSAPLGGLSPVSGYFAKGTENGSPSAKPKRKD